MLEVPSDEPRGLAALGLTQQVQGQSSHISAHLTQRGR